MEPSHYPPAPDETYRYDRPAKLLQQIDLDGPGATNPREVFWAWVQGFGLAGVIIGYAFLLCATVTSDGELVGPGATVARISAVVFFVGMCVAHFASSRSWSITMDARDLEDHHGLFLACSRAAMTIRGGRITTSRTLLSRTRCTASRSSSVARATRRNFRCPSRCAWRTPGAVPWSTTTSRGSGAGT